MNDIKMMVADDEVQWVCAAVLAGQSRSTRLPGEASFGADESLPGQSSSLILYSPLVNGV